MFEGLFQPFHLLVILFIAVLSYGMPFVAGYYLGRYVELKRLKDLTAIDRISRYRVFSTGIVR